jgi:hypothetical protein
MRTQSPLSLEDLIRSNPKVDAKLVASARASIEEIKRSGFVPEGYRLTGRRTLLVEKQSARREKERLPRRHR